MGFFSKLKLAFGGKDDSGKYTGIISAKEGKIVELEREIANLKAKDEQMVLLQKELANFKEATSKGDATIKAKEDRISGLERTVATLKEKLESAKSEPKVEPMPEPKVKAKREPRKPEPVAMKTPVPILDNSQPQSKSKTDDPYQQLGLELVDALRKTTKRADDDSGESG